MYNQSISVYNQSISVYNQSISVYNQSTSVYNCATNQDLCITNQYLSITNQYLCITPCNQSLSEQTIRAENAGRGESDADDLRRDGHDEAIPMRMLLLLLPKMPTGKKTFNLLRIP